MKLIKEAAGSIPKISMNLFQILIVILMHFPERIMLQCNIRRDCAAGSESGCPQALPI